MARHVKAPNAWLRLARALHKPNWVRHSSGVAETIPSRHPTFNGVLQSAIKTSSGHGSNGLHNDISSLPVPESRGVYGNMGIIGQA